MRCKPTSETKRINEKERVRAAVRKVKGRSLPSLHLLLYVLGLAR